jgi:hypothetical protein
MNMYVVILNRLKIKNAIIRRFAGRNAGIMLNYLSNDRYLEEIFYVKNVNSIV